jgi:DNA-binding MarR family transcriptional regulator
MADAGEQRAAVASEVRMSVMRLARRLRQQRPDHGLSLTRLAVLSRLDREGPATVTALALAERIQPQSMTRAVAELEQRGLLERSPHPSDRRQVVLRISDAGMDLLAADRRQRDEWLAVAMADTLTPVEQELVRLASSLLDRLAEA